ncbi:MAG: DUF87 domain-containing protein [Deltaproteobacteria bacterium]|nr:DUF87 domain-containing protein [Myxococcales bacterium]NNK44200.1 DUF87 domain-containing protein [Myxococcales bacterium]RZV55061.1 MAG: DUF87 domain-containing protein [Deltaproteobacteria bacterium]
MIDFEKLGKLYLGRELDPDGGEPNEVPVLYDSKDLTTHAVCVGMTGSGKTGLCLSLLEEAAIDGIPALCIDPKGDLGNLALTFPELRPSDFEPWIDPAEAERKGRTVTEHAAAVASLWREGLSKWGQDGARIARFRDAVDISIYTPGSSAGRGLRVLESFDPPGEDADDDEQRDQIMGAVSGLLALLGIDPDPVNSKEHILLSNLLSHAWSNGESLQLGDLVRGISEPPFDRIGVMDLETFYPASERQKLAMQMNGLLASPGFSTWLDGEPLDVQRLLWTEDGKPRITILSIAHLSEPERMFFVSTLLNRVVSWVRRQSGTSSLRALLYMDEVFGFLPPVSEPPSKRPLLTLLKQARAYGFGIVLATQNPVDLDYKALSNCGTWFLGRLQTERDVARVVDGLEAASSSSGSSLDRGAIERLLAGLRSRVFLLHNAHDEKDILFHTRWAMSYLRGPLTRKQIKRLSPGDDRSASSADRSAKPRRGAAATKKSRPVVAAGIDEAFLSDAPGTYRPHLLASVDLHYVRASQGLDEWEEFLALAPLDEDSPWESVEILDADSLDPDHGPPDEAEFVPPPSGSVGKARFRSYAKQLKDHLYQSRPKTLWRNKRLKLRSKPGETKAEFAARLQLARREKRDEAAEKLRKRFAKKIKSMEARIGRAEDKVAREKSQYDQQKLQTGISMGATVLGAIFGSRGMGRATTAARGAGRVAREREDVSRAEEDLRELQDDLRELEAEAEDKVRDLDAEMEREEPELEEVIVRPRKSDLRVSELRLAWKPD